MPSAAPDSLAFVRTIRSRLLAAGAAVALASAPAAAQETHLYWGDTHLHTSFSTDAYSSANTTIDPDAAYRFAKGEPVLHPVHRTRMRLDRPLDFLVVADHSDFLGAQIFIPRDDPRMENPESRQLQEFVGAAPGNIFALMLGTNTEWTRQRALDAYRPVMREPWLEAIAAAEANYEPGVFTTFAGWEWTSHIDNRNQHRVVFTPAPADALRSLFPYSSLDSQDPEDLWAWLEETSAATGSDFIAIPHNSNMADGLMFGLVDSDGNPLTEEYARTRARWEPVMEISQTKGASETHPALSPNDEFASFEIFNRLFFAKEPVPNAADFGRPALLRGLGLEAQLGVNPYKLGFIGSTDAHTGMSYMAENDFHGAVSRGDDPASRLAASQADRPTSAAASLAGWDLSAAGMAAVWATENTREAIAEAFKRREVYGTSGPRIGLRVFGGFNFRARDARADDIAAIGYEKGVPMGGDLTAAPRRRSPSFLIQAVMDPAAAHLDRIQVIKGWLDADGETHEDIYDVAWSGDRALGEDGSLQPVGDTVDVASASYENTIGAPSLSTVWTDPDFDPAERAFYYVRVLEIPTPRHHVYDAVALGVDAEDYGLPTRIQERAWSSPIWYAP